MAVINDERADHLRMLSSLLMGFTLVYHRAKKAGMEQADLDTIEAQRVEIRAAMKQLRAMQREELGQRG
jgi:hypothetical protein